MLINVTLTPIILHQMEKVHIQQWDEERFFSSRKEWTDLLARSDSDQLFLSWEWQSSWWQVFAETDSMQLTLLAATNEDGTLIGLAPLYCSTIKTKKIITTRRLQFIGNCWRERSTMPTELLDFIIDSSQSKNIIRAFYAYINRLKDWDEIIFPYLNLKSETCQLLIDEDLLHNCYLRHTETYSSYYLKTSGDFKKYTDNLGKNTRLKLINRRKVFAALGDTSFERMLSTNLDQNFELLNFLHEKRWGRPVFENKRLEFNRQVAKLMAERNCLNFSILSLNNKPVSIQFNYVINNWNYNIQAGFDESLHKKISLGYLHFGYEIEASFEQQYKAYDFLAGEGKNTPYKERLTDTYISMTDLQIIRKPLLKILYRSYSLFSPNVSW